MTIDLMRWLERISEPKALEDDMATKKARVKAGSWSRKPKQVAKKKPTMKVTSPVNPPPKPAWQNPPAPPVESMDDEILRLEGRLRRLKMAAHNTVTAKLKNTQADFLPAPLADAITDAVARNPKGGMSPAMEEILYPFSERRLFIVKSPKGTITNKEEFLEAMEKIHAKVVFLEYETNSPVAPSVDQIAKT